MKKIIFTIIICLISTSLFSQNRIVGTANDLKGFGSKTTMVVLSGDNSLMDIVLRSAIEDSWSISPFIFGTTSDFEKNKGDTSLFFLIRVKGQFKKENEPALEFLTLVRGGKGSLDEMTDIVTMPLQPLNDPEGATLSLVPSFIKIIQDHVYKVLENNISAYTGLAAHNDNVNEIGGRDILFAQDALSKQVTEKILKERFGGKAKVADEDEIEDALTKRSNTLIAFKISPITDKNGSFSYKLVIDAKNSELIYYNRHRISGRNPDGFLLEEVKRLSVPYLFK